MTTIDIESFTKNANVVKGLVLSRLLQDGIITEKNYLDYSEKWQMISVKANWFESLCQKMGIKDEEYIYKFVKFED